MKYNQSNIKKAKKYLDKGDCIGVPTETVYGLAANAYSSLAVKKIFKLKKRPQNNPLIVHYSNIKSLYLIAFSYPSKLISVALPFFLSLPVFLPAVFDELL